MRQLFTTTGQALRRRTPPMHLYEKARRYGVWNPSEIDFSRTGRIGSACGRVSSDRSGQTACATFSGEK